MSVLLSVTSHVYSQSAPIGDAQLAAHDAYKALIKAENNGANISELVEQLNIALDFKSQAQMLTNINPQEAQLLASQAQTLAQNVTAYASMAETVSVGAMAIVIAVVAVVAGVLIYLFGPKAYWKLWLKLRKNYRVTTRSSPIASKSLVITGEQVCAVIIVITLFVAVFAVLPLFLPKHSGEQFSELGLLGPNLTLGDFPSQVVVGDSVHFVVYIGNHMGKPMYYRVLVKLGDNNTTVNPASTQAIQEFDKVLPHTGALTFPVNITLTQPGLNQRIIFELWVYNETINQNQYHDRWVHVWLNVTAPAT